MREWYVLPGREVSYCPYCGNDIVTEYRALSNRAKVRNPDHRILNQSRKRIGGIAYDFDRYTCYNNE